MHCCVVGDLLVLSEFLRWRIFINFSFVIVIFWLVMEYEKSTEGCDNDER